jgi:hypothetical protein
VSRLLVIATAAIAVLLATAPASHAACPPKPMKQAFAQWLDPANYVLAEGGSFEVGTPSWALSGARVVAGNEPYFLNTPKDKRSLALDSGATATSPEMCVSLAHPTIRFVVRSTGSPLGALAVHALVRGPTGVLNVLPMGVATGLGSTWRPSLPMVLTNGLVGSLVDGSASVRFRFTVLGLGGAFQVDDVFVDPYQRG